MKKWMSYLFSACAVACTASMQAKEQVKSPQEIQLELNQAQKNFEIAQQMFIPWYTGPLITGSANNVPYGKFNIQGYLYATMDYAQFTNNRKSQSIDNIYSITPLLLLQYGLTDWLDVTLTGEGVMKWQNSYSAANFGDTSLLFGFQVIHEKPYIPSIRFTLGESFPSGKYQHFSADKSSIAGTGSGAYATSIGLNISKIIWWLPLHPLSLRWSNSYSIPNHTVSVEGFNAYGGGFGTDGSVKVGQTFNSDFGLEVSITQKWVFATDLAYSYSRKSTFSGTKGVTATGAQAQVGSNVSDQLSIAPAIEYNPSPQGGFIGGVWLPITGRNSSNFISAIASYTYLF